MEKGSLLRRNGVSFRSAAEESLIGNRSEECTPGPSRNVTSTPAPRDSNKYKRKAEKDRTAMENARKSTKQRIVEYSADESEDDDHDYDSEWGNRTKGTNHRCGERRTGCTVGYCELTTIRRWKTQ